MLKILSMYFKIFKNKTVIYLYIQNLKEYFLVVKYYEPTPGFICLQMALDLIFLSFMQQNPFNFKHQKCPNIFGVTVLWFIVTFVFKACQCFVLGRISIFYWLINTMYCNELLKSSNNTLDNLRCDDSIVIKLLNDSIQWNGPNISISFLLH